MTLTRRRSARPFATASTAAAPLALMTAGTIAANTRQTTVIEFEATLTDTGLCDSRSRTRSSASTTLRLVARTMVRLLDEFAASFA
jgi:hypothetical protein